MKGNYFPHLLWVFNLVISILLIGCRKDTDRELKIRIATLPVSNTSLSSASSGGNITDDGGTPITAKGVVWSTGHNPTISLLSKTSDGIGTGIFSSNLTGLSPNNIYYVRAYATNAAGTAYGKEVVFFTSSNLPTLTTTATRSVAASIASSGGNITSDGVASIISRGVCWGPEPNPTIQLNSKTTDGTGSGSFTSSVPGLTDGKRYYLRAYATNFVGTSYGNEVTFQAVPPFTELDSAIARRMRHYNIPALAVAITRNEKLVYIQSYGYASVASNRIASNTDLYRIASVSKPITVVAILKLVQEGLITLDQKVFGVDGILGNDYGTPPAGSNKDLITVRHLLDHSSGWTNSPYDPMFSIFTLTQAELIASLLLERPLTYTPGSKYYYLNFGYCVLGRVVEKVTGLTYENYVKSYATQIGITDMKVGSNTEPFPNEVTYYQPEYDPYLININRMDSPGGWIASATDLAKFIVTIDRNPFVPDIISTALLNQSYFGLSNWSHYGSLPGTSSILSRLDNTYNFVVLVNTRTEGNPDLIVNDLKTIVAGQITSRPAWPTFNLF